MFLYFATGLWQTISPLSKSPTGRKHLHCRAWKLDPCKKISNIEKWTLMAKEQAIANTNPIYTWFKPKVQWEFTKAKEWCRDKLLLFEPFNKRDNKKMSSHTSIPSTQKSIKHYFSIFQQQWLLSQSLNPGCVLHRGCHHFVVIVVWFCLHHRSRSSNIPQWELKLIDIYIMFYWVIPKT